MRYPRLEGRRVQGGTTPYPAQDLFARCQAMAEAYLMDLYTEMLGSRPVAPGEAPDGTDR